MVHKTKWLLINKTQCNKKIKDKTTQELKKQKKTKEL